MSAVSAEGTPASAGAADSVNTQKTVMPQIRRFSQLSPARQALVRLCQVVNFGEIQGIPVTDADPMFDDVCVVVIDAKLDKDEVPRPELGLVDFDLRADVDMKRRPKSPGLGFVIRRLKRLQNRVILVGTIPLSPERWRRSKTRRRVCPTW
jgi:hypothetical protein